MKTSIIFLTFITFLFPTFIIPVSLTVPTPLDLERQRHVMVHLNLDDGEAVIKNSMRFSVDVPHLFVKESVVMSTAVMKYLPTFKRNKSVYAGETIPVKLTLGVLKGSKDLGSLPVNVYFYGLVMGADGRVRPEVRMALLSKPQSINEVKMTPDIQSLPVQPKIDQPTVSQHTVVPTILHPQQSNINLSTLLQQKLTAARRIAVPLIFIFIALILIVVFFSPLWRVELIRFAKMVGIGLIIFLLYGKVHDAFVIACAMVFLLTNAWYYLSDTDTDAFVLHYAKLTLGALCAFVVPPLVIYLFLLKNEEVLQGVLGLLR